MLASLISDVSRKQMSKVVMVSAAATAVVAMAGARPLDIEGGVLLDPNHYAKGSGSLAGTYVAPITHQMYAWSRAVADGCR